MPLSFDNFAGHNFEELDNPIFSIALTPSAALAVAGEARSHLSVWNTRRGEWLDKSYGSLSVIAVAISPDQKRLICRGRLSSGQALSMQIWEIKMAIGRPFLRLATLRRNLAPSMALALSPDGQIAAWGEGSIVHVWNIETCESLRTIRGGSSEIQSLRFSPDGRLVASAGSDGVQVWDIQSGSLLLQYGNSLVPYALALMPDGRSLAAAGEDGTLSVFDFRRGSVSTTWRAHDSGFSLLAASSDGRKVVSGSLTDRTLRVWDIGATRRMAIATLPFGPLAMDLKRSLIAIGDRAGNVFFLYARQLTGTPVVTPVRLWEFGVCGFDRRPIRASAWSGDITVFCDWCARRSVPPSAVLEAINGIAANSKLEPADSPCIKLPDEAWDEPRLLSCCSLCHEPLKYNPFAVDGRDTQLLIN